MKINQTEINHEITYSEALENEGVYTTLSGSYIVVIKGSEGTTSFYMPMKMDLIEPCSTVKSCFLRRINKKLNISLI